MSQSVVNTLKNYISQLGYNSALHKVAFVNSNGKLSIHSSIFLLSDEKSSKPYHNMYSFGGIEIFEARLKIDELFSIIDKLASANPNNGTVGSLMNRNLDLPEDLQLVCGEHKLNVVGYFQDKGRLYGSSDNVFVKVDQNTPVWIFTYGLNSNYSAQSWPNTDFSRSRPPYENVQDCINDKLGLKLSVYSNSPYCGFILPVNKARITSCTLTDDKIDIKINFKKGFESKSLYLNTIYEKGMDRERESKDITIKDTHLEIKTKFKPERVMIHLVDGDLQLDVFSQIYLHRQETMSFAQSTDSQSGNSTNNDFYVKKSPTVFISHSIQDIELAKRIKYWLDHVGIQVFIAHQDIEPAKDWDIVIIEQLKSSSIFVALLTKNFQKSEWCAQEAGIALATNSIILPIKIEIDPYGFINKKQALRWSEDVPNIADLANIIIDNLPVEEQKRIRNELLEEGGRFSMCKSYDMAGVLSIIISKLPSITDEEMKLITSSVISNNQIYESMSAHRHLQSIFNTHKKMIPTRFLKNHIIASYLN